ncbi:restriction endonuclease subunit S [Mycoplasma capricolum subsp. capricolum]|uniref:restriction endonuclease subunit S n=1 Tax=Mycoplasma capricolum TaxID=2095 RepID=UPI003DA373D1
MKQNELFPKIRFKEFTNAWEQWKLSDIVQYKSSSMTSKDLIPYGKYDVYDPNRIAGKTNESPIEKEYISVVKDGDAGRIRLLPKNTMILSTMGALLASEGSNIEFIYFLLSNKNDLAKERNGSIIPHIYFRDYGENLYNIPKSNEQSKISSLFSNLDSLITLHQWECNFWKFRNFVFDFLKFSTRFFKKIQKYTHTWEQWKLSDIVQYKSSSMTSKDLIPYGKYDVYDPNRIAGKTNESPIEKEYISVVKDGDAGRIRLLPKNTMILSTMGALLASEGSNIEFIYFLLSNKNDLAKERNGSIIPHIYFRDYGENLYNIPKSNEQSKISSLFSNLDSLITLHQRKLILLKNTKNRLLEKMFCDEKSEFPSIRFKEFTNAWEQEKLGNLVNIYDGIHHTPHYENKGIMFLSVEDIETLNSNKFISDWEFKKYYKNYPTENDILMTRIGDIGSTNIVRDNSFKAYYVSLALLKYKKTNPQYLNNAIKSSFTQQDIWRLSLTTAIPIKINKDEIGKVNVCVTWINEQEKIGNIFSTLDSLITLHQRKLELLKSIKNTLLEKMFV